LPIAYVLGASGKVAPSARRCGARRTHHRNDAADDDQRGRRPTERFDTSTVAIRLRQHDRERINTRMPPM